MMNCTNKCTKINLNNCDCETILSTDCIEDSTGETLTTILQNIDKSIPCIRDAKLVQGNYEVQVEDACKILVLNGDVDSSNITYTIELPNTDDFVNKTLIFKDVSETGDPTGEVEWEFSQPILYNKGGVTTTKFHRLAWGPHKVLHLSLLKKDGVNYTWVVTSPSIGIPEVKVFTDADLLNNWVIAPGSYLKLYRLGNHRCLQGLVTGGSPPSSLLILDSIDRPAAPGGYFPVVSDVSPFRALLTITTSISVNFPSGPNLTGGEILSLFNVSWYVD